MKLTARDIGGFLKQPDVKAQAVLIYGPDSGLVRERALAITNTLLGKNYDPLNRVELTGAQVKADAAILLDELNAMSLMGGRRVVILREPTERIESVIKGAFEGTKNSTYLIIEAGELSSTSSIRKLFEKEEHFAALPCYLEDERGMEQTIRSILSGYGLNASQDAVLYLVSNLGNDRLVTLKELEKIALYMGEEKNVTLEIAMLLTGNNASEGFDDLCNSIALGKISESAKLLTHLLHEGTQPVAIVRTLVRYFQRLDLLQGYIKSGQNRDQAIKMLRPPIFYKSVPIIERALSRWSAAKISYSLNLLLRTEKELKSSILPPALLTSNTITSLQSL